MYTRPGYERRGVGRLTLDHCEAAAKSAGFARTELTATLAGEPFYKVCGYAETERLSTRSAARRRPSYGIV